MYNFRDGPYDSNRDDRNGDRNDSHARDSEGDRAGTSPQEARRRWGGHAVKGGPEVPNEPASSPLLCDRYGCFDINDEEFVVYDRENPDAWVNSSVVVSVGEVR